MPLNFAGTFPDPLNAGVTPYPLERQVSHQPHAAMNLDRFISHISQHLGCIEFGHRIV